jgi:hypothetical protein
MIPGPGLPILAVGAGLLAGESGRFARLLDAFEVWVRKALSAARRSWRRWPVWGRAAVVGAALVVAGATGLAAYRVAFGG